MMPPVNLSRKETEEQIMRIAYLVALVILANVLTAPNGYAGNSSVTVQIGVVNSSGTNQSGPTTTSNNATSLQFGAFNWAKMTQDGTTTTSNKSPVNCLNNGSSC
jgi:minor curlin subunit